MLNDSSLSAFWVKSTYLFQLCIHTQELVKIKDKRGKPELDMHVNMSFAIFIKSRVRQLVEKQQLIVKADKVDFILASWLCIVIKLVRGCMYDRMTVVELGRLILGGLQKIVNFSFFYLKIIFFVKLRHFSSPTQNIYFNLAPTDLS